MKRFFKITVLLVIITVFLSGINVFAKEAGKFALPETTQTSDKETVFTEVNVENPETDESTVNVALSLMPCMKVIDSFAVFDLYDESGKLLDEQSEWVGGITKEISLKFDVGRYTLGKTFVLKLKSGLSWIKYYDDVFREGEEVRLKTYFYTDDSGNIVKGNSFSLDAFPMYEHMIIVYVEGRQIQASPGARLVNGVSMVPANAVATAMGLDYRYDDRYNCAVCEIDGKQALFNMGTTYSTIFGEDKYLSQACELIDGSAFVPVRTLAESFGAPIEAIDFGDHIDVIIGESAMVREYMQREPINRWGIDSKTNYLVWVDKSNYRVNVYTGKKGMWKKVNSFPCALGAPDTPTITGSFEYLYRAQQWDYPNFYVGPCLVFYGGYAIHSTLLSYNGSDYDSRTGVKISHGCVRIHKPDIDWLAARLPIGSRIYVTE